MVKSPREINLPAKFQEWREGQTEIIEDAMRFQERFIAQVVPTGGGKTVCYMAVAKMRGGRTLILTSTIGLQDQLKREFGDLVTVQKGQSRYPCRVSPYTVMYGPCKWGYRCEYKEGGCPYYDQIRVSQTSQIVVTNYDFWFANEPERLGRFDLLVCDEAHDVISKMLESTAVRFRRAETSKYIKWPTEGDDLRVWAEVLNQTVKDKIKDTADINTVDAHNLLELSQKLDNLHKVRGDNCVAEIEKDSVNFDMIWPQRMAEPMLFRSIPKVLLVSATITKKTLDILGVDGILIEYPSYFPVSNRLVYYIPTTRVDHKMTNYQMQAWLSRIDQIIERNLDQKGIIHTVSYARADRIKNSSKFRDFMTVHNSKGTQRKVQEFIESDAPAILVSPSVTTGWDFPYDSARWQIIGKVPFPDSRSKVMQERIKKDKDYLSYLTAQVLVQTCGRGVRAKDDWCLNFVIDDHFCWFSRNHRSFFPKWFRDAIRTSLTIPRKEEVNNTRLGQ